MPDKPEQLKEDFEKELRHMFAQGKYYDHRGVPFTIDMICEILKLAEPLQTQLQLEIECKKDAMEYIQQQKKEMKALVSVSDLLQEFFKKQEFQIKEQRQEIERLKEIIAIASEQVNFKQFKNNNDDRK